MKKYIITALCVLCVCSCLVCLVACVNNASNVTASAQEETPSNAVYRNYEISLNSAPLHFLVPYSNYQTLNPSVTTYFAEDIIDYQFNSSGSPYQYVATMYFAYQVTDNIGNIYYEGIGQAGGLLNTYINTNGQYGYNANSIQGVTFSGTVANWYSLSTGERVFYPVVTTNSSYPFKVYISSENAIDITTFKLRSCSLHDLKVYGADDERIWANYNFVAGSSSNHRDLSMIDVQVTETSSPLYPVEQSPDIIYNVGYNAGYTNGYETAMDEAYQDGYDQGYSEGNSTGYRNGYANGESAGYNQGVLDSNDYSFLSLTSAVFDAPVTILTEMLDFEILGFNMRTLVLSLLSLALVFGLIKLFI